MQLHAIVVRDAMDVLCDGEAQPEGEAHGVELYRYTVF